MDRAFFIASGFLLVFFAFSANAQSSTTDANPQSNYLAEKSHDIDEQIFVGPQPELADLQNLQNQGIRRVVSFRTPGEMEQLGFSENQELAKLGIEFIEIPVGKGEYAYSPVQLNALIDVLQQDGKVLLHCKSGHRASVIAVAYLIQERGMPVNEALRYATGWWPLALEDVLDQEFLLVSKTQEN